MIPSFIDTNIFNFSFDIIPLYGGDNQEEKNILAYGGNMEELLQRYKVYLCGEHTKYNTIENKLGSARILLRETKGIITGESMLSFRAWANQHYSQNSRNNRINAWNQFLRWYTGDKGCPLQMKHIGFVETNQYALNEEELERVMRSVKGNPLARLVAVCLFDGALRPSEIIDIQIDRRDGNRLYLDDTKTGDKRIILSPVLQEAWADYLLVRPEPVPGHEQYLILKNYHKEAGRHYSDTHAINDMVRSIGQVAGLNQHLTPYTIRRTSATLRQCKYSRYYMGDDKLVQMLFRHKDLSTTKRYDRTSDIDIERYFEEQSREPTINRRKPTINRTVSTINGDDLQQILFIPRNDVEMNTGEMEDNSSFSFSVSFFVDISVTGVWGDAGLVMSNGLLFASSPPVSYLSVTLSYYCQWSSDPSFLDCWLMGRWVTGLGTPCAAVPSSPSEVESSFPPARLFCADEKAIGGFLFFHNFFLPNDFCPRSFQGTAAKFCHGSTPGSGVSSSERVEDAGIRLWRSNPGQVRALEYEGGDACI